MRLICLVTFFSILMVVASTQAQQQKEPASKNSDTIRLRCSGTLAANDVLYVVDGVLVTDREINLLDPTDIVSMDLIKESTTKIYSCYVKPKPVVLITTKKANRKILHVVDAKTNVGVSAASLHIASTNAAKVMAFIADDDGRYETDSLIADESLITVTATGYEPLQVTGKQAKQAGYRFELKPIFVELKEITVIAYSRISCGRGNAKMSALKMEELAGRFVCLAAGVKISETQSKKESAVIAEQAKIKVYPNPVAASGTVQLSFSDLKPGVYQIRLLSASGQLLYSFKKQITGKNETQQLPVNNAMPAGMYMIQVMDENKTLLQSSKLIVQ